MKNSYTGFYVRMSFVDISEIDLIIDVLLDKGYNVGKSFYLYDTMCHKNITIMLNVEEKNCFITRFLAGKIERVYDGVKDFNDRFFIDLMKQKLSK